MYQKQDYITIKHIPQPSKPGCRSGMISVGPITANQLCPSGIHTNRPSATCVGVLAPDYTTLVTFLGLGETVSPFLLSCFFFSFYFSFSFSLWLPHMGIYRAVITVAGRLLQYTQEHRRRGGLLQYRRHMNSTAAVCYSAADMLQCFHHFLQCFQHFYFPRKSYFLYV